MTTMKCEGKLPTLSSIWKLLTYWIYLTVKLDLLLLNCFKAAVFDDDSMKLEYERCFAMPLFKLSRISKTLKLSVLGAHKNKKNSLIKHETFCHNKHFVHGRVKFFDSFAFCDLKFAVLRLSLPNYFSSVELSNILCLVLSRCRLCSTVCYICVDCQREVFFRSRSRDFSRLFFESCQSCCHNC